METPLTDADFETEATPEAKSVRSETVATTVADVPTNVVFQQRLEEWETLLGLKEPHFGSKETFDESKDSPSSLMQPQTTCLCVFGGEKELRAVAHVLEQRKEIGKEMDPLQIMYRGCAEAVVKDLFRPMRHVTLFDIDEHNRVLCPTAMSLVDSHETLTPYRLSNAWQGWTINALCHFYKQCDRRVGIQRWILFQSEDESLEELLAINTPEDLEKTSSNGRAQGFSLRKPDAFAVRQGHVQECAFSDSLDLEAALIAPSSAPATRAAPRRNRPSWLDSFYLNGVQFVTTEDIKAAKRRTSDLFDRIIELSIPIYPHKFDWTLDMLSRSFFSLVFS